MNDPDEIEQQQAGLAPWVELADRLGVSRSLGQLYGLLFMANRPLSAQDCVDQLLISRSSAGQGLKVLKELGAIKPVFKVGDRSEHFVIEPDLGVLITKVLEGRLVPAFGAFFQAMRVGFQSGEGLPKERLEKLFRWEHKLGEALETAKEALL
jgi:hypothetical protein